MIKYENYIVLLFFVDCIKYVEDNKKDNLLISYMIRAIYKLFDYFKNNDDEDDYLTSSYLAEFLEKNGFKEILLKLQYNSDDMIMKYAEKMFDEFFDKDDDNNSININDIIGSDGNDE